MPPGRLGGLRRGPSTASASALKKRPNFLPALVLALALAHSGCGGRKDEGSIRILWAEWRPSDVLADLGRLYQAQTGIPVKVVKKSWEGAFGDAAFAEFRNRDDNYDIIIGDSQWLGLGAVGGHYLELTDWMEEGLDLASVDTSALKWYCEYPKSSRRYYAVPCEADAMAWAYRKDLFEDKDHREAFREYLGEKGVKAFPLEPPRTWEQLRLIALYFKERVPGMAGLVMPTSRKYDQATMSFEQVMWAFGGDFGDYADNRVLVNSPRTVEALRFFASLMEATSPGGRNMGYSEVASEFVAGRAAMACNFFAFFPLFVSPGDNPDFHDKTGFFNSPAHVDSQGVSRRAASLGGQGMSINAHISPARQQRAKDFLKWFSARETQRIWAEKGGFTSDRAILASPEFRKATAYNGLLEEAFRLMRDFWAVPEFDEMMKVCQREFCAVFQDRADPAEAAAQVQAEHEAILRKRGRAR